jgi:ABC-2 type transport system ATP-binding protein
MMYHFIDSNRRFGKWAGMLTEPAALPLAIADLHLSRGDRAVLDGLSMEVASGEIYALLGGNGAGKSTTLAAILGFLNASSGTIRVAGVDPSVDAEAARHTLAYLPENVALYDTLTAEENVAYFMALAGQSHTAAAIAAAFDQVGLQTEARIRRAGGYSKGMKQKVAIAMALLRDVPLLLLDEPTSGLDPRATGDFMALLRSLKAQGKAILMVTHDLLGAVDCADRIGFLDAGRIVEEIIVADGVDVLALHRRYGEAAAA